MPTRTAKDSTPHERDRPSRPTDLTHAWRKQLRRRRARPRHSTSGSYRSFLSTCVAVAFFNDVLDLRRLMPRRYHEAILLGAHALVRRPGHHDAALAPFGLPALALEVKLVIGISPATGTLAQLSDLLIDRPHQRLVSSLTLEPLLHRPSIRRRIRLSPPTATEPRGRHVELCGTAARFTPETPRWRRGDLALGSGWLTRGARSPRGWLRPTVCFASSSLAAQQIRTCP